MSWGSFMRTISCLGIGWRSRGLGVQAGAACDPSDGAGFSAFLAELSETSCDGCSSTRRSRPWGHLGTGLTFATPFGLVGTDVGVVSSGHRDCWGLVAWLAAMVLNRWVQAFANFAEGRWAIRTGCMGMMLYPHCAICWGGCVWVGSYGGDNFYYRGEDL